MVLLWLLLMAPAFAQPVAEPTAPVPAAEAATATLDAADDELLALRERLGETTDTAGFVQLRDAAVALDVRVQDAVRTLEAELAGVQGRLDELGPIPEDAAGEDAGIRERRAELAARVSVLDGAVKRGLNLGPYRRKSCLHHSPSAGSVPVGWPLAARVIFSTRSSASRRRFSQCWRRAAPRS